MALPELPLSLGMCRPTELGVKASKRRLRSGVSGEAFRSLQLDPSCYIASDGHVMILCHVIIPIQLPTLLEVERSLRVTWENSTCQAIDSITDNENSFHCTLKRHHGNSLQQDAISSIVHLCVTGDKLDKSHAEGTWSLGRVPWYPVLALSLSIELTAASASSRPRSTNSMSLFHAAVKRSFAGLNILWKQGAFTTEMTLTVNEETCLLRVLSATASRNEYDRHSPSHFIILPSTRITIEMCLPAISRASPRKPPLLEEASESPAIKELLEAITCMHSLPTASLSSSFLFSGQPGTGKTYAIRRVAELLGDDCRLVSLNGSEIMESGQGSEAARTLEKLFVNAHAALRTEPSGVALVFLDEFDALVESTPVVAMLAMLLERITTDLQWRRFVVVAATNRADSIPPQLRRPGGFDKEIVFDPPDVKTRQSILRKIIAESAGKDFELSESQLEALAEKCVGFVPADLVALVRNSLLLRITNPGCEASDLLNDALSNVGASALRDAALKAPPKTTWEDIAGDCGGAKLALQQAIEWPRTRKKAYEELGLVTPRGCLLFGPPGTGKTMLARAAAGASGVSFLSLSPADVFASSYVGDAEATIRRVFATARAAAPCVLFFDEIDAILGFDENSSSGMTRGHSAEARTLSTFLNEMDGIDGSMDDGVMVLGATNRPETIDRALLRPGRFDKVIHVPPPDFAGRRAILEKQFRGWETDGSLDFDCLARDDITGGMTGAEIVGVCRETARRAFIDTIKNGENLFMTHEILCDAFGKARGC